MTVKQREKTFGFLNFNNYTVRLAGVIYPLIFLLIFSTAYAGGKWYNYYADGLEEMKRGNWSMAIANFKEAIKLKYADAKKARTYGMHFIEYFPHREMGIAYYHSGKIEFARQELLLSLKQEYSSRAREYLSKIDEGSPPEAPVKKKIEEKKEPSPPKDVMLPEKKDIVQPKPEVEPIKIKLVGERMGLAVLPFETKGLGQEIAEFDIIDQLITEFVSLKRFKVMERAQIERILEEQKLGLSGIIDASTAAEIGKGIGVDAIVLGCVTSAGTAVSIDARIIDTETAEIITAQDDYSPTTSIQNIKTMIHNLALKISKDFPLVNGYVIGVDGRKITLDLGSECGVKKGTKCVVYREGEEIKHPITGEVLGTKTEELGKIKLTEVYERYSMGELIEIKAVTAIQVGDKIITK